MTVHTITESELEPFLATLGDKPETVISIHQLRHQIANAYIVGEPDDFRAAVVQYDMLPEEPIAFGDDADAIRAILQTLQGWDCVELASNMAEEITAYMTEACKCPIKQYEDVYYQLDKPLTENLQYDTSAELRLLNADDLAMVERTTMASQPNILGTIKKTLEDAVLAGAIVDGELIAFAESRESGKYVELGVMTHQAWQKRGLASALAALLIRHHQPSSRTIIWSTGEDNWASQHVAQKLGFREIMRRVYLIPQTKQ